MASSKDLIIGSAVGYTWDQLKPLINSLKAIEFQGSVVLVGSDMTKETIERLTENGVELYLYGQKKENGDIASSKSLMPHVERFFYINEFLKKNFSRFNRVVMVDTRDVIFQSDPFEWLDTNLTMHNIVASGEGMRYCNEPWGNSNLFQAFGPFVHKELKDNLIYNVGVVAGFTADMLFLTSMLFQLSLNRPIAIVDQAVYNYLIKSVPYCDDVYFTSNADTWAVNLGTAKLAVQAGNGDLGAHYVSDEKFRQQYFMNYEDHQPNVVDGVVQNHNDRPFCIVHQYDRVPGLKEKILERYA